MWAIVFCDLGGHSVAIPKSVPLQFTTTLSRQEKKLLFPFIVTDIWDFTIPFTAVLFISRPAEVIDQNIDA